MDIDDFPLSEDDKQQIDDAVTKLDIYVIEQKQLVSYQWLSNELAIDALIARQALAAFIEQHRDEVDVLWLLSGRATAVNKYGVHSQPQEQQPESSGSASSGGSNSSSYINIDEDDTGDTVTVHEMALVRDADLAAIKQQFESVTSLHPYSISIKPQAESQPIQDITAALYTLQMQQLLAMYDQPPDEDNALRDGRYGAIVPDPHIKRSATAASLSSNGIIDHPNGHSRDNQPSTPSLTSAAAAQSSAATAAGASPSEMLGLKKTSSKGNALANMFSKQTAALKQSPLPVAARADDKAVEDPRSMQSNAATVLPAEEEKEERRGKQGKAKVDESKSESMDVETEDAEAAAEEDDKPAGKGKRKPTSSSRKSKPKKGKPATSSSKKKRKRHEEADEFVYPNPYDSHSDEEKEVAEAEEEEEERYRAAAVVEDVDGAADEQAVPSSIAREEEREDERMDGTEAGSRFRQFFTSQPSSQSPSSMLPKQRRKVQKTFVDDDGYMRVEDVEEEDEEADKQRVDREKEEERAREEKETKRKEQREKERREKEEAEEEEQERKEKEKKEKREQKKQEKKQQAEKDKEDEAARQTGRRTKRKAGAGDDEVVEEEDNEKEDKTKEKAGKGGKKGKQAKEEATESPKEKAVVSKAESEKGGKKGGKAGADSKPKNNASILSFFNRK